MNSYHSLLGRPLVLAAWSQQKPWLSGKEGAVSRPVHEPDARSTENTNELWDVGSVYKGRDHESTETYLLTACFND